MIKKILKGLARKFPSAARHAYYARFNLRDIYDTYLARPVAPAITPFGFKMGGLASQAHAAMQQGTFEPDEVALLTSLLPHVDVFVDVGANVGYFTCLARSLGKYAIAVEPMPKNLSALYANLQANNWSDTEVLPMGASSRTGIQTLYGASGTGASLIDNWAGAPSAFKRTICVSTLDNMVAGRFSERRMFVKIDVEGHEHETLLGAQTLLTRTVRPLWLVEITFQEYHPSGRNPAFSESFRLFFSSGYRAFLISKGSLKEIGQADVQRWEAAGKTDSLEINYLFVPPDMLDHLQVRASS